MRNLASLGPDHMSVPASITQIIDVKIVHYHQHHAAVIEDFGRLTHAYITNQVCNSQLLKNLIPRVVEVYHPPSVAPEPRSNLFLCSSLPPPESCCCRTPNEHPLPARNCSAPPYLHTLSLHQQSGDSPVASGRCPTTTPHYPTSCHPPPYQYHTRPDVAERAKGGIREASGVR